MAANEAKAFRTRIALMEELSEDTEKFSISFFYSKTRTYSFEGPERKRRSIIHLAALNNTTDARDKVYGLLALMKNKLPGIVTPDVDYSNSVAEVYEDFMRCIMDRTESLWALGFIGSTGTPGDLPSWVLDLRDLNLINEPEWIRPTRPRDVDPNESRNVDLRRREVLSLRGTLRNHNERANANVGNDI
jgi:hypothetical protein